jgi:hypothetical protein
MKGLINIKNNDEKCFMWCHIAHLFPATKNKFRLSNYINHEKDVDYSGVKFPVTINQIKKIEKLNKINFNIFTLCDNDSKVLPYYNSNNTFNNVCNMLLINKLNEDKSIQSHYVLITDISKLLASQNKQNKRLEYCLRCLQHFYNIDKLNEHMINCNKVSCQRTLFPNKSNKMIKFKNYKNKIPVPFVVYADFEALNTKYINPEPKPKPKRKSKIEEKIKKNQQ